MNEWYKAAYFDPTLNGGAGGYWSFPAKSNNVPRNALSSTGTNNANFNNGLAGLAGFTDPTNFLTPVGYFPGSPGPWNTYDMGGDVWDWTDTMDPFFAYTACRGGAFALAPHRLNHAA